MAKHKTPLLDQLESGPWPSFVSDIKQEAANRAKNEKGLDYQVAVDCPEDLLGVLEMSYTDGETHWKHGGIVGVFGYGGGVIGRYCDQPEMFPGVAHFHTIRVAQPNGKWYNTKLLRDLMDIWDLRGSGLTNMHGATGDIVSSVPRLLSLRNLLGTDSRSGHRPRWFRLQPAYPATCMGCLAVSTPVTTLRNCVTT